MLLRWQQRGAGRDDWSPAAHRRQGGGTSVVRLAAPPWQPPPAAPAAWPQMLCSAAHPPR